MLRSIARMSIDAASSRLVFALVGAAILHVTVDVKLLALELAVSSAALAMWRSLYTLTNSDRR